MKNKILMLALILGLVLLSSTAVYAYAKKNQVIYPIKPGTTVLLPCSSGMVKAYVTDGMGVVECLPNEMDSN